ncbi:alpha/beta hydrolase family protein [Actinocorallia herbida]|uniref:Alpha/beta hydrolase family protein n=1 Tax=Actinocorallia herbida TaxID=58109 RepID=A0A3N1CXB0_9ACTN|nr:alpha/beta fold hydrolase [Actinocorallia herbida]ROO85927.1 alpha/beta hydrolase family protein [Actinocorallia herbida]
MSRGVACRPADRAARPRGVPGAPEIVDVAGIPMSALVSRAPAPRAVIVAMHGGMTTGRYFDVPELPRQSLLRTASALGFTVVAPDRPGVGASAPHERLFADSARRRVDLVHGLLDALVPPGSRGAGLFVVGHSRGTELALQLAADERGADLLGVEIAATGRRLHPEAEKVMARHRRGERPSGLDTVLWGPERLYPESVARGLRVFAPNPSYEAVEGPRWQEMLPRYAAAVRVPVHLTLGDHERWWQTGPEALADLAALFTAAPRVVAEMQADAGHNLSLGRTALAYHLRVLSFAEECAAARG